ncbi:MAG: glycosyltransferase [Ignavibacteriaceae bacterium]|nr:glycosyltransferase [Ignavibacteriaceae bacterium]
MSKTLSLCMIAKNEALNLPRCLSSVNEVIDEIVIADTGSDDETVELAKSYNARVFQFEWTNDFSAARNYALSKCTGDLILYLDADESLDPSSINELLNIKKSGETAGYYCTVKSFDNDSSYDNTMRYVRLFPRIERIAFSGKVHEQIVPSLKENNITIRQSKILINHFGYNVSAELKKLKAARNLRLLLDEYEKSSSPYYAFQLGNTYNILDDDLNAEKFYKIAGGSSELEKTHRAQCYTFLALINHKNFKGELAERNIKLSLQLDSQQPFSYLAAAKILLRNGDMAAAEEKCKLAFLLNQKLKNGGENSISIILNSEEIIYFGLMLAVNTKNEKYLKFYKDELFNYYNSLYGKEINYTKVINKLFANSAMNIQEVNDLYKITNKYNLTFFLQLLSQNPNNNQVIEVVKRFRQDHPSNVEVAKNLAKLYEEAGEILEPIEILEEALSNFENDPAIYLYLITLYLKKGDFDKISKILNEVEVRFSGISAVTERLKSIKKLLASVLKLT